MKRIYLAILGLFVWNASVAQQDVQFSMFNSAKLLVNPGSAGMDGNLCFDALYRNQWMGMDGAPEDFYFSAQTPFLGDDNGAGITILKDALGRESNVGVKLAYARFITLNTGGRIGLGLDAGILNKSLDFTNMRAHQQGDPVLINNQNGTASDIKVDVGFGAYFTSSDNNLYFGLSSVKLPQGNADFNGASLSLVRHYYLMGGYNIEITPGWEIEPSVLLKSDLAESIIDANLRIKYDKRIWLGATYRHDESVVAMFGLNHPIGDNMMKFGVAYDYTLNDLRGGEGSSNGSVEAHLGFCIPMDKEPPLTKYADPLDL